MARKKRAKKVEEEKGRRAEEKRHLPPLPI
jgi:hypothetical protein